MNMCICLPIYEYVYTGNLKEVKFTFINTLWAWVSVANDMKDAGFELNFDPKAMWHE